jgi:hypothetical protein
LFCWLIANPDTFGGRRVHERQAGFTLVV